MPGSRKGVKWGQCTGVGLRLCRRTTLKSAFFAPTERLRFCAALEEKIFLVHFNFFGYYGTSKAKQV